VTPSSIAEAVIKRDRNIVLAGLAAIVVVATYCTINMAQSYNGVAAAMLLLHDHAGHGSDGFLNLFFMWTVMQVAMMSPTAVPMILMHTKIERHRHPEQSPIFPTTLFFLGYIIVWAVFSAVLAEVQMVLQSTTLLSPQMASASPWLAGGILITAGLFQFSRLKEACLSQCRSPVTYFMLEWRESSTGALQMGFKHGVYCVGCCWVLMALLFVAGVMNLLWMAVITGFVLLEKVMPKGDLFGRVGGAGMVIWGICLIVIT
jgi:predicted metal-binding membrane protein